MSQSRAAGPSDDGDGSKFVAENVGNLITAVDAKTPLIEPGSPWACGYCESSNTRFRNELLDGESFYSLREAQILIEQWRRQYNTVRPRSAPGYRTPGQGSMSFCVVMTTMTNPKTSNSMARYARQNINMNDLMPGFCENVNLSEFARQSFPAQSPASFAEIGQACVFFASEGERYITGQNILSDGAMNRALR